MNLIIAAHSSVMLVDMFCLGSIYTVTRRQVYLSPDPGPLYFYISDGNIVTLCLVASLPHLKHQSIYFKTLDNFRSEPGCWWGGGEVYK